MTISRNISEWSDEMSDETQNILLSMEQQQIVIYGAGSDFNQFKKNVILKHGLKPTVLIDKKFPRGEYIGFGSVHPDDYNPTREEAAASIAIIALGFPQNKRDAREYLAAKGFPHIFDSARLYDHFLINQPEGFEEDGKDYYKNRQETIEKAYGLMADDLSKKVFENFLMSFVLKRGMVLPCDEHQPQYFDTSVPRRHDFSRCRWINGGAFDGDTIRDFLNLGHNHNAIYAFEPSLSNFTLLLGSMAKMKYSENRKILPFPFALWSDNQSLKFLGDSKGACVTNSAAGINIQNIQGISLDKLPIKFKPTFFNLDVEGAELEALYGAQKTIIEYTPDLAVCVYHNVSHLWDIPNYIDGLGCGYKFFLRNYTGSVMETVLYASAI